MTEVEEPTRRLTIMIYKTLSDRCHQHHTLTDRVRFSSVSHLFSLSTNPSNWSVDRPEPGGDIATQMVVRVSRELPKDIALLPRYRDGRTAGVGDVDLR